MSGEETSRSAAQPAVPRSLGRLVDRAVLPPVRVHDPWADALYTAPASALPGTVAIRGEPTPERSVSPSTSDARPAPPLVSVGVHRVPEDVLVDPPPTSAILVVAARTTAPASAWLEPDRGPASLLLPSRPVSTGPPPAGTSPSSSRANAAAAPRLIFPAAPTPAGPSAGPRAANKTSTAEPDDAAAGQAASVPAAEAAAPPRVREPVQPGPTRLGPSEATHDGAAEPPHSSGPTHPPSAVPAQTSASADAGAPPATDRPIERPAGPAVPPVEIGRIEVVVTAPEPAPDPFAGCHALEAATGAPRGGGW
jgi:hypothetical protein